MAAIIPARDPARTPLWQPAQLALRPLVPRTARLPAAGECPGFKCLVTPVLAADEQRPEFLAVALLGPGGPAAAKPFHMLITVAGVIVGAGATALSACSHGDGAAGRQARPTPCPSSQKMARAASPLPPARRPPALPGDSARELPGGLHLHLHGVSAGDVAEIVRRDLRETTRQAAQPRQGKDRRAARTGAGSERPSSGAGPGPRPYRGWNATPRRPPGARVGLWVPKTCATWADALRDAVGPVTRMVPGGQVLVRAGVR